MSRISTIRVKSENPSHKGGFFIRNADDLRYGEVLFKAEEFEALGEHEIRLKLESSPPDEFFVAEAKLWLGLKEKERLDSDEAARNARENETLLMAKEANSIARNASRYALIAIIITAILAIIKIYDFIFNTP